MPIDEHQLRLKAHCLATGIRVSREATEALTRHGEVPLTVHEYATTGGITFRSGDMYVNAPFDEWFCARSAAELVLADTGDFVVRFAGEDTTVEVLPLPGYLDADNGQGAPVTDTTMSHADRIRLSPITGCALDCGFCDFPALRYTRHSASELLASLSVARADANLPAHHMLISGGSPGPAHFEWFDATLTEIATSAGFPVDVMMSPRVGSVDYVQRLVDAGVQGFSFNLEVFGAERATEIMPRKHRRSTPYMEKTLAAAVDAVDGPGRVRSLVIVGLDRPEDTLAAVEFLSSLGCDPVLSPFRPARDTKLAAWEPPSESQLLDTWYAADEIARRNGARLGPRCIPCQHNTLVLPDGSSDYWYTSGLHAGAA